MIAFPKPRPHALDRAEKQAARETRDKRESQAARHRANGRCECWILGEGRCWKRDTETHHLLDGWRIRGRGDSASRLHKQRLCKAHHDAMKAHTLRLVPSGKLPVWFDHYIRVQ